ncbi:MAG: class I SAM-dependent methyltransferase [Burkholderiaceae bacterium]
MAESVPGFDDGTHAALARHEGGHFWFEARNRLLLDSARRHFSDPCRFLELGCGSGFTLQALALAFPRWQLSGTEATIEGLRIAAARTPRARLLQADGRDLPFTSEFDLVGAFDVLEHIHEGDRVLSEIHRSLRPRGCVMLTVPQHRWLWSEQDELAGHVRRYDPGELEAALRRAGFEILDSIGFMAPLVPLMWLSRRRTASRERIADNELAPSRLVNLALSLVLALERVAIRIGARWPFGGSRLVVARKRSSNA